MWDRSVKAKEVVEPFFNFVAERITDRDFSFISRSVRTFGGAFAIGFLEDEGLELSLSCWISLREGDRPVPS